MRSKIGIVGWNTSENTFGVTKAYAQFLSHFGDLVTIHPQQGVVEGLDLLVLPGGQDVSSYLYGEVPGYYNSNADLMKEFFMKNNLQQYIDAGTPIFGICLGMQQLYVHFGGKLIQEIDGMHPRSSPQNRGEEVHDLQFTPAFTPRSTETIHVNSLHHQSCDPDTCPDELSIVAVSCLKGKKNDSHFSAVEVIKHNELPIWGVQYHPEEIYDTLSIKLIKQLLAHARETKTIQTIG